MKIECCSKQLLRFEILNRLRDLENNEILEMKISKCEVLKDTFDLEVISKFVKTTK